MAGFTFNEVTLNHPSLYYALQLLASLRKPQHYLEVGVREGDSLKIVVEAALSSLQKLVLCDDWGGGYGGTARGSHQHVAELLTSWGYTHEVQWVDGDSHQVLRPAIEGQTFDLILIDGDHSEAGARQDLMDVYSSLAPQGLLLFDDVYFASHPWLTDVLHKFVQEMPYLELLAEMTDSASGVAVVRGA